MSTTPALHALIFSKDRACQLDSLLRSLVDHMHVRLSTVTILCACSHERYREAYHLLMAQKFMDGIHWRFEDDFATDTRSVLGEMPDEELVMLLVDDDIMYRPFKEQSIFERLSKKHLFITIRADIAHERYELPVFLPVGGVREWRWNYRKGSPSPWSYPFSLDGNILKGRTLKRMIKRINFKAPNTLEGAMHRGRHAWWVKRMPLALAPMRSVVYNNPLNRVQTEGETWHRDITAAELNEQYLGGFRLNNAALYEVVPSDVHFAVAPEYEPFEARSTK
ncbi:MAG: hypothetical protein GF344_04920 [Chitinivibrionales bacterium]|nr:hypothetical protein [Chitinivibrionales bacterium]MBD3356342.1 hypothetical protein [Chitinivibrionales bacterium]